MLATFWSNFKWVYDPSKTPSNFQKQDKIISFRHQLSCYCFDFQRKALAWPVRQQDTMYSGYDFLFVPLGTRIRFIDLSAVLYDIIYAGTPEEKKMLCILAFCWSRLILVVEKGYLRIIRCDLLAEEVGRAHTHITLMATTVSKQTERKRFWTVPWECFLLRRREREKGVDHLLL